MSEMRKQSVASIADIPPSVVEKRRQLLFADRVRKIELELLRKRSVNSKELNELFVSTGSLAKGEYEQRRLAILGICIIRKRGLVDYG